MHVWPMSCQTHPCRRMLCHHERALAEAAAETLSSSLVSASLLPWCLLFVGVIHLQHGYTFSPQPGYFRAQHNTL